MIRFARLNRKTNETDINIELRLDGTGALTGTNPIPFFHHMLSHLMKYSLMDLTLDLKGDIQIDCHHTVEDTAIVLGKIFLIALGDKRGIHRYGTFTLPMDEVLTTVTIDLSGRSHFRYTGPDLRSMGKFGIYDSELTLEFLDKLSQHLMMNLHVQVHYGENHHHIHESIFKCLGFAIRQAIAFDARRENEVPSTKGVLD